MDQPAVIRKLDESVINRIAAGEIIHRPANALKEMIENSIDAKSTNIQITVKDGGLKLLQISDNGTGIRKEDFGIVCERFTTSKLEKFEDLQSIATYGFRGEALASISHVARLSIQSKVVSEVCAYRASFQDGKLAEQPKPCAGNQGTIITVEDLFYNMATRRKTLKNPAEEYQKVSDVVGKYAIHNATIGFGLRKHNGNNDIRTPPNSKHIDNIRTVYGSAIARELMEMEGGDETLKFKLHGFVSNVNFSRKKSTFIFFINHRLVDSSGLKRCLEQMYATYLQKNGHPFVYLSIEIDPRNVDVNVHPTKHEVMFLDEEQIIDKVTKLVERKILECNNSRTYYTQAKLPGVSMEIVSISDPKTSPKKVHDKNLVRTDANEQKLEKFFGPSTSKKEDSGNVANDTFKNILKSKIDKSLRVDVQLTSVIELRNACYDDMQLSFRKLFVEHVFVGCVNTRFALVQHETKLFLCDTGMIVRELFYQFAVYFFQNFDKIRFSEPLSLHDLAKIALDLPETQWRPEDGDKEALATEIARILTSKAEMLDEYFSVEIDKDGNLITIPLLLENHVPQMAGLPMYVLRLATEVNWDVEKECFETFCRETARYYSERYEENIAENENWKWTTEHVLYPAIKEYLMPPKAFTENGAVLQVADLPDLYKVFERC